MFTAGVRCHAQGCMALRAHTMAMRYVRGAKNGHMRHIFTIRAHAWKRRKSLIPTHTQPGQLAQVPCGAARTVLAQ